MKNKIKEELNEVVSKEPVADSRLKDDILVII
jgi:hypothetical protein